MNNDTFNEMKVNNISIKKANKLFLFVITLYFVVNIIVVLLSRQLNVDVTSRYSTIVIITIQYGVLLLPVIFFTMYNKIEIKSFFRVNKLKLSEAMLIILISFFASFVATGLNSIVIFFLQKLGNVPIDNFVNPTTPLEYIRDIFLIAVTPALCEELLNRGILLRAYEKYDTKKAIILTSIIFGIFHFDIRNLIGASFLGIFIAYYVIRTNSILAGMLAHFTNKLIAVSISFFLKPENEELYIDITLEQLNAIVYLGLIFSTLIWIFLRIFKSVTDKRNNIYIKNQGNILRAVLLDWQMWIIFVLYIFITLLFIFRMK